MKNYNFTKRHWSVIVICFFILILNNSCTTDGENVLLSKIAQANNWQYSTVLTLATVAGCLSVVGQLVFGKLCAKKGPRKTLILCLLLTAVCLVTYASAKSLWLYALGLFGVISCSTSYSYIGGNALIANWFPRKKGLAMGIVSMGAPVSTIVVVSSLTFLITAVGLTKGVMVIAALLVIMAIVSIFFLYDKPEDCGLLPDNMEEPIENLEEGEGNLSTNDLLHMKGFWQIIAIIGGLSLCSTGLMAQFIVRYTSSGYSEAKAILMLSLCAAVGVVSSALMGRVENGLGTKKAYVIFASIFILAFLINFTDIKPLVYLSIFLFGCVITTLQVFLTSFEMTVFGRENFSKANSIIYPVISMIGQTAFLVISICLKVFGEMRYAYLIFALVLFFTIIVNKGIKSSDDERK